MSQLDPTLATSKKGLQRDPKYYSTAWRRRQHQLDVLSASPSSSKLSLATNSDDGKFHLPFLYVYFCDMNPILYVCSFL